MRGFRGVEDRSLLALFALALVSPLAMLGQGSTAAAAVFACPAVLISATVSIEVMTGLAAGMRRAARRGR